jgi:transcriptional regulator with XRE-family HTH domain
MSICVIVLREVRTERGYHQAQIADLIGIKLNAWAKVEAGKSPLSFETFLRACYSMQLMPSEVMLAVERYANLFRNEGWAIVNSELDFNEECLLRQAQEYWALSDCRHTIKNYWYDTLVLNGPIFNTDQPIKLPAVFRFALDSDFHKLQLNYTTAEVPSSQPNVVGTHNV